MEPSDNYNFSLFTPRNLHGRKNRNVILSMLVIWAVAVFGFQVLLVVIQKPTPEKALIMFESTWPKVLENDLTTMDFKTFVNSLVLVKGKNIVKPADQVVLSNAISCVTYKFIPDSTKMILLGGIDDVVLLKQKLTESEGQEYLDIRFRIREKNKQLTDIIEPFSGFGHGSLEATILISGLKKECPSSFDDESFSRLPGIMKLYLTHNQSVLTDTKFLGFPFHYFYTAVFLLILFVGLCIAYNLLIEWRLKEQGVVE